LGGDVVHLDDGRQLAGAAQAGEELVQGVVIGPLEDEVDGHLVLGAVEGLDEGLEGVLVGGGHGVPEGDADRAGGLGLLRRLAAAATGRRQQDQQRGQQEYGSSH